MIEHVRPGSDRHSRVRRRPRVRTLPALFLTLACGVAWACAQDRPIRFEHLTVRDGLSQDSIQSLFQDRHGFLWISTLDGLNKYDGRKFRVYRHDDADPASIADDIPGSVFEDHAGRLWCTAGGAICLLDRATGKFRMYRPGFKELSNLRYSAMTVTSEDRAGNLWVDSGDGLFRFDPARGVFSLYEGNGARGFVDPLGFLWLIRNQFRVSRVDLEHNRSTTIPYSGYCFQGASRDHIWLRTVEGDFVKFDLHRQVGRKFQDHPGYPRIPPDWKLNGVVEDTAGALWFGTANAGVRRFDPNSRRFTRFRHDPADPASLANDNVTAVLPGKGEIVWLATYGGGLDSTSPFRNKFGRIAYRSGDARALNDPWIYPVLQDRRRRLWIGTLYGGLNVWDRVTGKIAVYPRKTCFDDGQLYCLLQDRSGSLWAGGHFLYRLDETSGRFIREYPTGKPGPSEADVRTLLEDRSGTLWVGYNGGGLLRWDRGAGRSTLFRHDPADRNSLADNMIATLYADRTGRIWVGTIRGGLDCLNPATGRFSHFPPAPAAKTGVSHSRVNTVAEGAGGILWIGTAGGLDRFDPERGVLERFRRRDGLPSDYIYGILPDRQGSLWMSTTAGLVRFDPKRRTFRTFTLSDGLLSNEFDGNSCFQSADGEMFFGGINGVIYFRPETVRENPHAPSVVITSFRVHDREIRQEITADTEIRLPYDQNFITLEFAALDFTDPLKNQYVYQLEGIDRKPVFCGNRNYTSYSDLSPGRRLFRVRGSNSDGVWNERGLAVTLVITPPFWRTSPFLAAAGVVFVLASYLLVSFIRKYFYLIAFWKKRTRIGQYVLANPIGYGGMATVYRAHHLLNRKRQVAIKLLRDEFALNPLQRKRFKQEGALIDRIDHPNIVKIFERGSHEENLYIVMELLEGQTLARRIRDGGRFPPGDCARVLSQIAGVLARIHRRGIIHRDLKPANIMLVTREGDPLFVKVLDFGLAQVQNQSRLTQSGTLLGTIHYIPPEQITQSIFSPAGDMYALGIIAYEMATGEIPFPSGSTLEIMKRIVQQVPEPPLALRPDLPPGLSALISRMIDKDPARRPTADEALAELEGLSPGAPPTN